MLFSHRFSILCSDASAGRSILVFKHDVDKVITPLHDNSHVKQGTITIVSNHIWCCLFCSALLLDYGAGQSQAPRWVRHPCGHHELYGIHPKEFEIIWTQQWLEVIHQRRSKLHSRRGDYIEFEIWNTTVFLIRNVFSICNNSLFIMFYCNVLLQLAKALRKGPYQTNLLLAGWVLVLCCAVMWCDVMWCDVTEQYYALVTSQQRCAWCDWEETHIFT